MNITQLKLTLTSKIVEATHVPKKFNQPLGKKRSSRNHKQILDRLCRSTKQLTQKISLVKLANFEISPHLGWHLQDQYNHPPNSTNLDLAGFSTSAQRGKHTPHQVPHNINLVTKKALIWNCLSRCCFVLWIAT